MYCFFHKWRKLSPALLAVLLSCTNSTSPVEPGVEPSVLSVGLSSQPPEQDQLPMERVPAACLRVTGNQEVSTLTVSWSECTDQAFDRYVLYRSENPNISFDLASATVLTEITSPGTTVFEDQAELNTKYYYMLRTSDIDQNSVCSNEVPFITPDISNSILFENGISPLSLELAWTSCLDHTFRSYHLFRSETPGIQEDTTCAELLKLTFAFGNTSFSDSDFERWSTYYYAVLTTGISGETCWNNEIEVNTQDDLLSEVESTVDVGSNPWDATSPYPESFVYVTIRGEDRVSVIRTSDDRVIETVPVGAAPYGICSHPSGEFVYTANSGSNDLSVIRTSDNEVVDIVEAGDTPVDVCVLPSGEFLYVANRNDNTVSVIRTSDNTVTETVDVGSHPHELCTLPSGDYIYVSNWGSGNASVIRTSDNTVADVISLYPNPTGILSSPSGEFIYVSILSNDTVAMIRSSDNSLAGTFEVGDAPWGGCVYYSGFCMYLVNSYSDTVNIILRSDHSMLSTVQVGSTPLNICALTDGTALYVVNYSDGTVSVIR